MAKNRVNVDVKVSDKGSLKQVGDKSRQSDRALKGMAKTSSSGTKNFSKMSQGITGGLVPAYATLAANLFAITALFSALKEAADLRVMREGMEQYAATTGIAMMGIAASLQQATHMQLNYGEAMKSTATLTAAGFNKTMILEMGTAARQASAALGHNFEDAFNRITKGIQKAEPELLDELGIILRLDQATRNFAIANNLVQDDLTLFQRTMAVHNEVISQATEKYGSLNKEIKVSGIVQLGTAFENVKKSALEGLSPIAEFFAGVFKDNIALVIAAMLGFAISMLKAAGMGDMLATKAASWTTNAEAAAVSAKTKQVEYNWELRNTKLEMSQIKKEAAGMLQGMTMGKSGKKLMKGTGDFEGKQRLMKGQIGMIPNRVLKEWKKLGPGMSGVTKNMTQKQVDHFHLMVGDILRKNKRLEAEFKGGWKRMSLFAGVQMAKVKSMFATIGSGMAGMASGIGRIAGGMMSIAGKVAMFTMVYQMGKKMATDMHSYVESMLTWAKKVPFMKKWAEESLKATENWREMREHSKVMNEQMNRIDTVNENIAKQGEEVEKISDNWNMATSQMEKYVMLGRLLNSINFTAQIEEAASALTRAREKTKEVLESLAIKMEGVDVESASEVTFDEAKKESDARGIRGLRFENVHDLDWVDKWLTNHYSESALRIKQASLEAAGEAMLDDEAAEAWQDNWIAMHRINSSTSKIVADAARTEAGSKEKFDAIIEGMGGIISKVKQRSEEMGLGGVDFDIFATTYETEMKREGGGDPVIAAQLAAKAWLEAKKPLVDFVGELDSLKSVTEAYNKTANKLFQKTMPTGWGKQFNTLQDMQKIYKEGRDSKIITDTTEIDEQQLKMFNSMGLLTDEVRKQVALAIKGDILWEDIHVKWKSLFETGGAITREQQRAYDIAWGYEARILDQKEKQIEMQSVATKFSGALGKKAQYHLNVEKNISQQQINRENMSKMIENQEDKDEEGYKNKLRGIELQNLALEKQLELMEEQETLQFQLVNIMQQSFTNLFEEAIKGEEKFHETFKKIARSMFAQMASLMAQQAAINTLMGLFPNSKYLAGAFGSREGGITTQRGDSGYKSFQGGGVASGSQSGYLATLHGTEAVVPLGNDRSIPVKMEGNTQSNNVVVNISGVGQGQQGGQTATGDGLQQIGALIGNTVQGVLVDELRPGGLLYSGRRG